MPPLLVLAPLEVVPPLERDGAADGLPPPPPDGMDGRLAAPPLPLRDGAEDDGLDADGGAGGADGEPSTRPRGAEIERPGLVTGSERDADGGVYERERGSAEGSVACRSLLLHTRERGAAGAGASSVAMRARGAVVDSGMLLPTRERGAVETGASSVREREDAG